MNLLAYNIWEMKVSFMFTHNNSDVYLGFAAWTYKYRRYYL